jgi:predicted benzoate:H+ symporter BenE
MKWGDFFENKPKSLPRCVVAGIFLMMGITADGAKEMNRCCGAVTVVFFVSPDIVIPRYPMIELPLLSAGSAHWLLYGGLMWKVWDLFFIDVMKF